MFRTYIMLKYIESSILNQCQVSYQIILKVTHFKPEVTNHLKKNVLRNHIFLKSES